MEDQSYLQFKFPSEVEGDEDFFINRTDSNYQTFLIEYGENLELISLKQSFMYHRHQSMLVGEVDSPLIED